MSKRAVLPNDLKQECIWIVRGYKRRVSAYMEARREIIDGTGCRYETIKDEKTGKYIRVYPPHGNMPGRASEDKMQQLSAIEDWPETKKMRAVEHARIGAGPDLPHEMRQKLVDAILLNCENRREYPYEYLDVSGMGKTDFYERRTAFLVDIANFLGYI